VFLLLISPRYFHYSISSWLSGAVPSPPPFTLLPKSTDTWSTLQVPLTLLSLSCCFITPQTSALSAQKLVYTHSTESSSHPSNYYYLIRIPPRALPVRPRIWGQVKILKCSAQWIHFQAYHRYTLPEVTGRNGSRVSPHRAAASRSIWFPALPLPDYIIEVIRRDSKYSSRDMVKCTVHCPTSQLDCDWSPPKSKKKMDSKAKFRFLFISVVKP